MDGGIGDGQQRRKGQQDSRVIAMGNGMAVHIGQHNGQRTIATNTEAAQWEVMQDGQQWQSGWTVAA